MGEHRLAGDVADRVDRRIRGATALVDRNDAARVDAGAGRLEPQAGADRRAADRDQHAVERLDRVAAEAGLDRRAPLRERRHRGAEPDLREELLAPPRERLDQVAVRARQQAVGHLGDGDHAPERGVDLTELETDIAAADHEQPLRNIRQLERRGGIHDAIGLEREAGHARRERAGRHDRVLEADLLGLVALDAQLARALEHGAAADHLDALGLRDRREAARQPAHDSLGLPLAQRVERDVRLAELDADLAGARGVLDQRGDVQQRLGRDAALPEAGAAEPLAGVHDYRLESQLGAAERRRIAAGAAADHGHVHLDHEVAHHHRRITSRGATAPDARAGARWPRRSARRRRRRRRGGRT